MTISLVDCDQFTSIDCVELPQCTDPALPSFDDHHPSLVRKHASSLFDASSCAVYA